MNDKFIFLILFFSIGIFFTINFELVLGSPESQNGLYKDSGEPAYLLEKGETANIVFYLRDDMEGNITSAKILYFILVDYDESKNPDESRMIFLNSTDSLNPIKIPYSWNQSGSFFLRQQIEYFDDEQISWSHQSSNMQIIVVDKLGKAVTDEGICKKEGLVPTFKHDFSKIACVSFEIAYELGIRGWSAGR